MIFRVIGAAVVYGFALYGAAKFLDRPKMEVLIKAEATRNEEHQPGNAGTATAASGDGESAG